MTDKHRKILSRINLNGALIYAVSLAWLFMLIYHLSDKSRLMSVMNALLAGSIVTVAISFSRYIYYAISSADPWSRARQFGISTGVVWASIVCLLLASIQRHGTSTYNPNATYFTDILSRYLAIIAATMQVFAPDFGKNLFYGTERKLFIIGSLAGAVVAIILIVLQADNFMDW